MCARRGAYRSGSVRGRWPFATPASKEASTISTSASACCVVHEGAIGFAATVELGPTPPPSSPSALSTPSRTTALAGNRRIELADEPVYADATWAWSYRIDPTAVEASEVIGRLEAWSAELIGAPGVDHVTADLLAVTEDKHYGDLAGTVPPSAEFGCTRPSKRWRSTATGDVRDDAHARPAGRPGLRVPRGRGLGLRRRARHAARPARREARRAVGRRLVDTTSSSTRRTSG